VRRLGEEDADFRRSIVTSAETLNTIVDASIRELERLRAKTGEKRLKIIASALNFEHCRQIVEAYRARGRRADSGYIPETGRADSQLRCSGQKWVVSWQTMSFIVELPDSVAEALRLPPADAEAEVRKELALALYARGILGFGKARELCGLTKWQFEELLGRRKVIRPYDEDDLAVDLAYARRSQ
jgi:predicted HTH domain antitoxin